MKFEQCLNSLQQVVNKEMMNNWFEDLITGLGLEYFCFSFSMPQSMQDNAHFILTNYPENWLNEYSENGYRHIDPFNNHCLESATPIIWADINNYPRFNTSEYKKYISRLRNYRLDNGLSVALRGKGCSICILNFNWNIDKSADQVTELALLAQTILPYLFDSAKHLKVVDNQASRLTKREVECVSWAIDGKTSWEISKILGLSERTVVFHMTNLIRKTDTANRQQAIAKALMQGIVEPVMQ